MRKHEPSVTLRQIAEYARHARELCGGRTLAEVTGDWQRAFAFESVMEVLGEAVKRLPTNSDKNIPRYPGGWLLGCGTKSAML